MKSTLRDRERRTHSSDYTLLTKARHAGCPFVLRNTSAQVTEHWWWSQTHWAAPGLVPAKRQPLVAASGSVPAHEPPLVAASGSDKTASAVEQVAKQQRGVGIRVPSRCYRTLDNPLN